MKLKEGAESKEGKKEGGRGEGEGMERKERG